MQMVIDGRGTVRCVYAEWIDLATLGLPMIERASHVEPDAAGLWVADLSLVGGPRLGPFARRSDALAAEHHWLETNWLTGSAPIEAVAPNEVAINIRLLGPTRYERPAR